MITTMKFPKKSFAAALLLVCAATAVTPMQAEAASARKKQQAMYAYRTFMNQSQIPWTSWSFAPASQVEFATADINKDGIKELILRWSYASHAEGWDRIYTYRNGKVKSLGEFTSVTISKNKNYFTNYYMGTGGSLNYFYRLKKNGKKECLVKYQTSDVPPTNAKGSVVKKHNKTFGRDVYYYGMKVNGKRVSYKKCMKKVRSLEKKSRTLSLTYHKNTMENVGRYL